MSEKDFEEGYTKGFKEGRKVGYKESAVYTEASLNESYKQRVLSWRDVQDPCENCQGSGKRLYGSTSTWRGGIGGAAMTTDVCDKCWGSGDKYKLGTDLRKAAQVIEDLRREIAELKESKNV